MGKNVKITGSKVGSDGTGYYRGNNGRYYYGNPQNGYLTETRQSQQARSQSASSSYSQSSGYSGGGAASGGVLEYLLGGVASAALLAGIVATFFIAIVVSLVMVWPYYIGLLADCYTSGRVDLAAIILTAIVAFLIVYFFVCVYQVFATKRMRSKHYLLVCTLSMTAPSILFAIAMGDPGKIIEYALQGIILGVFPCFLLCFVEHVVTKKVRRDKEWFITKISRLVGRVFPGHGVGLIIFGVLLLLFAPMYNALSQVQTDLSPFISPAAYAVAGVLVIIMGALAKKKGV